MSDEFFGPPTDFPEDVPAETQADGAVTEDNTGEQVADKAGNAGWFDSNYPGDITKSAANPTQDAYGLNILSAAETKELTRNINPAFINNLVDPNTPIDAAGNNAVNKIAASLPAFVDSTGVAFNPVTGISYPVDRPGGKQLIPTDVLAATDPAAKARIETFNQTPYRSATPVNPGQSNLAGPPDTFIKDAAGNWVENPKYAVNTSAKPVATESPYTETRQTAEAAAAKNANSEFPNPYLTNIEKAGATLAKNDAEIANAKETIQSAQQNIATTESNIAKNNAELANPDISAERKAQLEAENAGYVQNIFNQTQTITNQQTNITDAEKSIVVNNDVINENAAAYRDTTNPIKTTTVPVATDQYQNESAVINPTTKKAEPVKQVGTPWDDEGNLNPGWIIRNGVPVFVGGTVVAQATQAQAAADRTAAGRALAQKQAVLAAQKKKANDEDWRVRLSLAPGANYLYNDSNNSILRPLAVTGGVIFPYTPKIEMSYKADYESYALTHSNYKGYFYKSSSVDPVNMSAVFTAQDSAEANYLLAVIHFFRSVTKMFYGQDKNPLAGAPPPLVFLTGLGQYQFANQPCVVTAFNYNLPNDVDYIRAGSPNINGTNMLTRRDRQDLPTNPISGAVARLQNLWSSQGIMPGANRTPPLVPSLSQNQPTYVPTRLEFSISLLPVQTRRQMSRQFSLQDYASGALAGGKYDSSRSGPFIGGFW
jgi:hypothetical protein